MCVCARACVGACVCACVCVQGYCVCFQHLRSSDWLEGSLINPVSSFSSKQTKVFAVIATAMRHTLTEPLTLQPVSVYLCGFFFLPLISFHLSQCFTSSPSPGYFWIPKKSEMPSRVI